jgi:AraC-like DNA-binding protein
MLGTVLSVFSDAHDLKAALREGGDVDLVTASIGEFRAHVSQIWLLHMRLLTCEERVSRIAFISVPPNMVRVTLPPKPKASLMWDGIRAWPGEIVTHGAGHRFHERTNGQCRWSTVFLPVRDLARAGRATRGTAFVVPVGERRWRPAPDALRSLVSLHDDATRATTMRPRLPIEREAARGLEQQLVLALIECLVNETTDRDGKSERRQADVMIRFEDALRATPVATLSVTGIARALGVSNTDLRKCCHAHLGMAPARYLYLRRMA